MANKIPQELRDIAKNLGCNVIDYVTTTKEGDIYSLAAVGENGEYLDTGLPILYAVRGSIVSELQEPRIKEILKSINNEQ